MLIDYTRIMATWKEKFNKKYNHPKGASHSLSDISKETGVSKKGIQQIYNKGIGAYKTNPQSVRPNVTSKEQWAYARVYSSVMGGKASKVDAKELKMEMGGKVNFNVGAVDVHDEADVLVDGIFEKGDVISGKKLKQYVEKSDYGDDLSFLDYIEDKDYYVLENIDVNVQIQKDGTLSDYINSIVELEPNVNEVGWINKPPIIVGDSDYERGVVLDGYHRIRQAKSNREKTISAFIKTLKYEKGGEVKMTYITKVVLSDFDKKGYFGQYKKVFNAFNKGSLGLTEGAYELDSSGQRDNEGNYILLISQDTSNGDLVERLSKIKGISFEEIYIDKNIFQMGGVLLNPNFKKWFGDSKVVDENGNPLVVYHGTDEDFDEFLYGIELAKKQDELGQYSGYSNQFGVHFGTKRASNYFAKDDGSILPVYLKIENPLRVPDLGAWDSYQIFAYLIQDLGWEYLRELDEEDYYEMGVLKNVLKSKGYDGFVYVNNLEGGGTDSYVVFEPSQVKSALGNSGEFDSKNLNITMEMGGSTDDFDRTDYYKSYYERLSPSNFIVEKENEKITINMNDRYKEGGKVNFNVGAVDVHDEADVLVDGIFEKGGETNFNPDGKIKDKIVHASGDAGGMLVGKRHSNGGIKALNKSTGQPLEMEGGEVVITRNAVSDNKKRSFNGKMMTNRQILSSINESGGGVSFADGGQVPNDVQFDCNAEYEYGGKTMCGKDLAYAMGGVTTAIVTDPNEAMADLQSTYGFGDVYANGGIVWKKNIGNEGWSSTMESNNAYENEGGYISEDGNWKIYRLGDFYKRDFGDNYERRGAWTVTYKNKPIGYRGSSQPMYLSNLKDAKEFISQINNEKFAKGGLAKGYHKMPDGTIMKDSDHYAKGGTIDCGSCDWSWDRKDGGDDMYVCHKCGTDNEKYFGIDNTFEENIPFKEGGEVKSFQYPLTSEDKGLIYNKAIISVTSKRTTRIILGIIESIKDSDFSFKIIYDSLFNIDNSSVYSISENQIVDILNGTPLINEYGTFKYEKDINNIKELTLFQIETALKIQKEYGIYFRSLNIPDFFRKVLNTDAPVVDEIKVTDSYTSYQEFYKNYIQGISILGNARYGDRVAYFINDNNGVISQFRVGKKKVIKNNDNGYWRIGNGKKIPPYYDWLLSVYGNTGSSIEYNYEKFVSGTNENYLKFQKVRKEQEKVRKEQEKKERKERQLLEANVFNYEKNFSLMNQIEEKGIWKDLGLSEPFEQEKGLYYKLLKKDLNTLSELLPNFQGTRDVLKRKKIIKEMSKIQQKLLQLDINVNESLTKPNDLFTSEGLLNYYFTQTTQSPVTPLDKPCGLPTPNGGKSKLPMSAYLNVRTSQFKKWFGDWEVAYDTNNYNGCSLMIDEDTKEPKIYYHGVSKFRGGQRGASAMGSGVTRPYGAFTPTGFNASYFADNMEYAKFYSGTSEILPQQFKTKGFVYSIFLNIKNPIDLLPLGLKCTYKNIKDYLLIVYGVELQYNATLLKKMNDDINSKNNTWQYIRNDSLLIDKLKDFGYDAIFQIGDIPKYNKKGEVVGIIEDKEFLTFEPNQVKSVGVLNSFYGEMFKDIRFKKGGYVSI